MRFSPNKAHALAAQIVAMLEEDEAAELLVPANEIEMAVAGAIIADLKEEDEIDVEVDEVLSEYERRIEMEGMDAQLLRHKVKSEIAKKRGFAV